MALASTQCRPPGHYILALYRRRNIRCQRNRLGRQCEEPYACLVRHQYVVSVYFTLPFLISDFRSNEDYRWRIIRPSSCDALHLQAPRDGLVFP